MCGITMPHLLSLRDETCAAMTIPLRDQTGQVLHPAPLVVPRHCSQPWIPACYNHLVTKGDAAGTPDIEMYCYRIYDKKIMLKNMHRRKDENVLNFRL